MKNWTINIILITLLSSTLSLKAIAAEKRSKNINFEDELIEGINRKSIDSVNQLSEIDSNRRKHLYYKRAGFADKDRFALEELKLKD